MSGSVTDRSARSSRGPSVGVSSDPFSSLRDDAESSPAPVGDHTPKGPSGQSQFPSARSNNGMQRRAVDSSREEQQNNHGNGHHYDGDEDELESRRDKLKTRVNKRSEQSVTNSIKDENKRSNWWIYLSLVAHFAVLLWCIVLVARVDTGLSCSRPLRGITVGILIILLVAFLSTGLTHWHVQSTLKKYLTAPHVVVREEFEDAQEEGQAGGGGHTERIGMLSNQHREMIISRSLTDRMLAGGCSFCFLLCASIVLFSLLVSLFIYAVLQKNDCNTLMPNYVRNSGPFCGALLAVLIVHVYVYMKLMEDIGIMYEIHFIQQSVIKSHVEEPAGERRQG